MRITQILQRVSVSLLVIAFLATACAPGVTVAPSPAATEAAVPVGTTIPTETTAPTGTAVLTETTVPTDTAVPTATLTPTPAPTLTRTPWPAGLPGLRDLAEKHNLDLGVAVQSGLIEKEAPYRETLLREFNVITSEWEMKMCVNWPERERWDFAGGDALVKFAEENGLKIRGHTLVWVGCEPDWIRSGVFTKEEAKDLLKEYITTVVSRYKGKIYAWDVLNETVQRASVWDKLIGPEYRALAFQWAHEADPGALLFYNDFDIEKPGAKFDAVYNFVKELKDQGVPIHGLGMQMHFRVTPLMEHVAKNMQRIADLGLEIHVTEFDLPIDHYDADPLAEQALGYREMLRVCLDQEKCTTFIMWGFTDNYSWLYEQLNDPNAEPLIFDREYRPKPAYEAIYMELQK